MLGARTPRRIPKVLRCSSISTPATRLSAIPVTAPNILRSAAHLPRGSNSGQVDCLNSLLQQRVASFSPIALERCVPVEFVIPSRRLHVAMPRRAQQSQLFHQFRIIGFHMRYSRNLVSAGSVVLLQDQFARARTAPPGAFRALQA